MMRHHSWTFLLVLWTFLLVLWRGTIERHDSMDLLARTLERKRLREPPPDLVPSASAEPNLAIAPAEPNLVNGWKLKQYKNGSSQMRQVSFPIGTSRKKLMARSRLHPRRWHTPSIHRPTHPPIPLQKQPTLNTSQ